MFVRPVAAYLAAPMAVVLLLPCPGRLALIRRAAAAGDLDITRSVVPGRGMSVRSAQP